MIVLEIDEKGNKEVRKVILSDKINRKNVWVIGEALSQTWVSNSKMFPAPRFDIVIGICDDIENVEKELPRSSGWDSVDIERLTVKA